MRLQTGQHGGWCSFHKANHFYPRGNRNTAKSAMLWLPHLKSPKLNRPFFLWQIVVARKVMYSKLVACNCILIAYSSAFLLYIHIDDWRCDQYRWQNQGVTKLPRGDPVIRKMYFVADTTEGIAKFHHNHILLPLNTNMALFLTCRQQRNHTFTLCRQ